MAKHNAAHEANKAQATMPKANNSLSEVESLILKAIEFNPLKTEKYKGLNSVIGGLNDLLRQKFGLDKDQIIAVQSDMARKGLIVVNWARKGVTLYLPKDAPAQKSQAASSLAAAIGVSL